MSCHDLAFAANRCWNVPELVSADSFQTHIAAVRCFPVGTMTRMTWLWAVVAAVVMVLAPSCHVCAGAAIWAQSNGNVYSTFGPLAGAAQWQPVGNLSLYERLHSEQQTPLVNVLPVVDSAGTVYIADACFNDCNIIPRQLHGVTPGSGGGIGLAAVAANGTQLWRIPNFALNAGQSLALSHDERVLLTIESSNVPLSAIDTATGERLESTGPQLQSGRMEVTVDTVNQMVYGCGPTGTDAAGMQALSYSFFVANGGGDLDVTQRWKNPATGVGAMPFCSARPPVTPDVERDVLTVSKDCTVARYSSSYGTVTYPFNAVTGLTFPGNGTATCNSRLTVNPVTKTVLVTGTYTPAPSSQLGGGSFVVSRNLVGALHGFMTNFGSTSSVAVTSDGAVIFCTLGHGVVCACACVSVWCVCPCAVFRRGLARLTLPRGLSHLAQWVDSRHNPLVTPLCTCNVWHPTAQRCTMCSSSLVMTATSAKLPC